MTAAPTPPAPVRANRARSVLKRARPALAIALMVAVAGCESASDLDVFGVFADEPPATETAGQAAVRERADRQSAEASEQEPPSLSSVPARPEAATPPDVRQRVVEGLVADRANARYSDQNVRLQGSTVAPAAAEQVPAETAAPAPAASPPPAATTAPPPPQVSAVPPPRTSAPTRVTPPPPPHTAQTARAPVPVPSGPAPDVRVDPSAISGGGGFPTRANRVTLDEQVATIHFAHSSSRLDERDKQVLAQVASAQRQNAADVLVVGHASGRTQQLDKVEHELANFRISLARANRVAEQLIALGVAPDKVQVEAFADSDPVYSEEMPTGEAGNRRADIYFRQ